MTKCLRSFNTVNFHFSILIEPEHVFLPNEFSFNMNIKENHYHTISVQFLYNGFEITFNENIYGKKNVKINFKHLPILGQIIQLSFLENDLSPLIKYG